MLRNGAGFPQPASHIATMALTTMKMHGRRMTFDLGMVGLSVFILEI